MSVNSEANKVIDNIIEQRRSVRSFKLDIPNKEDIEAIIHAGLWAPYAAISIPDVQDFRRFFVIQKGNPILNKIVDLVQQESKVSLVRLDKLFIEKPFLREKSKRFTDLLSSTAKSGFPHLLNAPCLIIIAERKGMPPVEKQSLAHVIQNMWLKATALGLGMQLVSSIETLTEYKQLSDLLGLNFGQFAFSGCIIGFPDQEPQAARRPRDNEVLKWL
jgi:nitroreductase